MWYVYMVRCADQSLYTGVTTNVKERVHEHNDSARGAKYTRVRRPVTLIYNESAASQSEALIREHAIKKLTRAQKIKLIESLSLMD